MRNSHLVITGLCGLLTGCPGVEYPSCSGQRVTVPGGKCGAYYYQADYGSGGATTQALVDCLIDAQHLGGNVVAFHTLAHGIGLKWLNANTLEVAVPAGVKLEDQRRMDRYMGHELIFRYRTLQPNEQEFTGCLAKAGGGT